MYNIAHELQIYIANLKKPEEDFCMDATRMILIIKPLKNLKEPPLPPSSSNNILYVFLKIKAAVQKYEFLLPQEDKIHILNCRVIFIVLNNLKNPVEPVH